MFRSAYAYFASLFARLAAIWQQMFAGKPVAKQEFRDDGHEYLRMTAPFTYDDKASPDTDRPEVVRGFA